MFKITGEYELWVNFWWIHHKRDKQEKEEQDKLSF